MACRTMAILRVVRGQNLGQTRCAAVMQKETAAKRPSSGGVSKAEPATPRRHPLFPHHGLAMDRT